MIRTGAALALFLCSCVTAYPRRAPPRQEPGSFDVHHQAGEVWSVEELAARLRDSYSRGDRVIAVGRTVIRGVDPIEFQVELLDILHGFVYAGHDFIFGKLLDDNEVVARAGVTGGMSGSPIYLDGRLIGALSYRLGSFAKVPFCGITPIEYMMREMDRAEEPFGRAAAPSDFGPVAVPTPITISGASPRSARILESLMRELGWDPGLVAVPAASGSAIFDPPERLVPGGAIGALLMTGDSTMAATGTVTFVDGDRVLAFGHPFFGTGATDIPMTAAVVHEIFAGLSASNKISSPGRVVGALIHDRSNAIYGEMGREARLVPVTVRLRSEAGGERELHYEVIRDRDWLPMLVDFAVSDAADAYEPWGHDRVVVSRSTVRLAGGRSATWESVSASGGGMGMFRILTGGSPIARIVNNEFERPEIESVEVENEYLNADRAATIHRMWAATPEVEPGGTADVRVQLRRFRAEDEFVDLSVPIPAEIRPGTDVTIRIGGGDVIQPELPPAASLDDILAQIGTGHRATELVAVVELEAFRVLYQGRTIERVPASIVAQMTPGLEEQALLTRASARTVRETEWVIRGSGTVTVHVKEDE